MHKARDGFKRQLTKGEDDDDDESDDDDYTEEDFKVGFLESKYSKKLLTNNNNQTVTADDKTLHFIRFMLQVPVPIVYVEVDVAFMLLYL